jgi:hypothetical protein
MRLIIFSFALLTISATVNCSKSSCTYKSSCVYKTDTQDKKVALQLTEYEVFAQKYEATFGEKPSDVWNLGKESCGSACGRE